MEVKKKFFHDKPGWSIALRIVLVLLLIEGLAWITRAAFYQGVAVGTGKVNPGYMMFSEDDDMMDFHHPDGDEFHDGFSGYMFSHRPGSTRPYTGYGGPMGHHSEGSFISGFFHLLFGFLGFLLLIKLIFGFGGVGMYRYGPMDWGPGRQGHHGQHHHHHRCDCNCDHRDKQPAPDEKPQK